MTEYALKIKYPQYRRTFERTFFFNARDDADAGDVLNTLDMLINKYHGKHTVDDTPAVTVELLTPAQAAPLPDYMAAMPSPVRNVSFMPYLVTLNGERQGFFSDERQAIAHATSFFNNHGGDVRVWKEYPADEIQSIGGATLDIDGRYFKVFWRITDDTKQPHPRPEMPTATSNQTTMFDPQAEIAKLANRLDHMAKANEELRAVVNDRINATVERLDNFERAAADRLFKIDKRLTDAEAAISAVRVPTTAITELRNRFSAMEQMLAPSGGISAFTARLDALEHAMRDPRSTLKDQLREMLNDIERNG